jgi:hypothetical protein
VLTRDAQTVLCCGRGAAVYGDVRKFVASDKALFCEAFDVGGGAGGPGAAWASAWLVPARWDEDEQAHQSGPVRGVRGVGLDGGDDKGDDVDGWRSCDGSVLEKRRGRVE